MTEVPAVQNLTFQSTTFDVVDRNGQPWIQSRQLADALGYRDESSVRKIYERNTDEFTDEMTQVIEITQTVNLTAPSNLVTRTRIFSLRGCHLLAMFARTSVAKAFRVWVLDVLEKLDKPADPPQPVPSPDLYSHLPKPGPMTPSVFEFQHNKVHALTLHDNGPVWFVVSDVCAVLGLSWDWRTQKPVPREWRTMLVLNLLGKNKRVSCITEPGVYELTFQSDRPEAEAFANWIASEVIPAVRKTGNHSSLPYDMTLEQRRKVAGWVKEQIAKTIAQAEYEARSRAEKNASPPKALPPPEPKVKTPPRRFPAPWDLVLNMHSRICEAEADLKKAKMRLSLARKTAEDMFAQAVGGGQEVDA